MPSRIPFQPSQNNYRMLVPMDNQVFIIDPKWNEQDQAWYFDLREQDETPILIGVKVVLGKLGRTSTHQFFKDRTIDVIDTSGGRLDPGFDDLGARVQVLVTSVTEVI